MKLGLSLLKTRTEVITMESVIIKEKFSNLVYKYFGFEKLTVQQKEHLEAYFDYLTQNGSKSQLTKTWIRAIFMNLRDFAKVLGERSFMETTEEDFNRYYDNVIKTRNISFQTLEAYCNILRNFFNWLFTNTDKMKYLKSIEYGVILKFKEDMVNKNADYDPIENELRSKERILQKMLSNPEILQEQREVLIRL